LDNNWHVSAVIHCQLSVRNDIEINSNVLQQWYASAFVKSNNNLSALICHYYLFWCRIYYCWFWNTFSFYLCVKRYLCGCLYTVKKLAIHKCSQSEPVDFDLVTERGNCILLFPGDGHHCCQLKELCFVI